MHNISGKEFEHSFKTVFYLIHCLHISLSRVFVYAQLDIVAHWPLLHEHICVDMFFYKYMMY